MLLTLLQSGGSGTTTYTLTCQPGAFTLTGQSASLLKSKLITASAGSFVLTGQNATLYKSNVLNASAGAFTLSGQSATLTYYQRYVLDGQSGTFTLSGQSADLTYTPAGVYTLTCQAGAFTLSGQSATLTHTAVVDTPVGGGLSSSRRNRKPSLVIVEVDGKEYRVQASQLQEFLDAISEKAEAVAEVSKKRKARKQKASDIKTAPVVTIVSAPVEEIALIQRHIDRTNEIMREVFEGALKRYLDELEDEEALLWLIV